MNSHSNIEHEEAPQAVRSPVERLLADARLSLVETGTRNRLVHTPRAGKRTRSLPIIGADADNLFDSLVRSTRGLRFLPASLERELTLEIRADYDAGSIHCGAVQRHIDGGGWTGDVLATVPVSPAQGLSR